MNGSKKQIEYANVLRDQLIDQLRANLSVYNNPEKLKNKTIEGYTKEQLEHRAEMISKMEKQIEVTNNVIDIVANFTGYAGNLIDAIKLGLISEAITRIVDGKTIVTVGWQNIRDNK